jgi:heme-degrading monooxygenase HmoA
MHFVIWEFTVREGKADDFIAAYGPTGAWATLFHRGRGFEGTQLLRSSADANFFITIDRWDSTDRFDEFMAEFAEEYRELDKRLEQFTVSETKRGVFAEA